MSSFRWGMKASTEIRNCQVTGWETERAPALSSPQYCCSLWPQKHASTIWGLTQSLLWANQATISHLKEEILGYLRIQKILIFLINRCSLSQVQNTSFQHGFLVCRPQPTSSTLWPVIQANIAREHATVSQMKDLIKAFHLNPNNQKFLV